MPEGKKPIYKRWWFIALAVLLVLPACDSLEEKEEERTYEVRYEASGTFDACTMTFTDENESVIQREEPLPWSLEYEVTVREFASHLATVSAICTAEGDQTLELMLIVDGAAQEVIPAVGTFASADATVTLALDGVEKQ